MWYFVVRLCFVFFSETATNEIYTYGHTLSLHYALPISRLPRARQRRDRRHRPVQHRRRDSLLRPAGARRRPPLLSLVRGGVPVPRRPRATRAGVGEIGRAHV